MSINIKNYYNFSPDHINSLLQPAVAWASSVLVYHNNQKLPEGDRATQAHRGVRLLNLAEYTYVSRSRLGPTWDLFGKHMGKTCPHCPACTHLGPINTIFAQICPVGAQTCPVGAQLEPICAKWAPHCPVKNPYGPHLICWLGLFLSWQASVTNFLKTTQKWNSISITNNIMKT